MALRFLRSRPVLISSLQAGSLMCVGDVISQKFIEKKAKIEVIRTVRFGVLGMVMVGPFFHTWYKFVETHIVIQSRLVSALTKVTVDQVIRAPIFFVVFLIVNSLAQGNSWEKAEADLRSTFKDVMVANYQVWPAAQMINFTFVPPQRRVLFGQVVACAWNTYMSWKTNADVKS